MVDRELVLNLAGPLEPGDVARSDGTDLVDPLEQDGEARSDGTDLADLLEPGGAVGLEP